MATRFFKRMKNILVLIGLVLISAACQRNIPQSETPNSSTSEVNQEESVNTDPQYLENQEVSSEALIFSPISRPQERVTKKPFGIYITPKTSPVQPEKFQGYHTGTDFETFPEEADTDVPILAICTGKLLQKRTATGYGGLLVQACNLDGQAVTVVYGHIKLSSVSAKVGDELKRAEQIAVLGKGYSSETSGERKHLHLGIHNGTSIVILGYVQSQSALSAWKDALKLF